MYEIPAIGKFLEDSDFVPAVPPAARRLRPGETLVRRWNGRGFDEWVERRGASPPPGPPAPSSRPAGPASPADEVGYVHVPADDVPAAARRAVVSNVRLWAQRLGLSYVPTVRFYRRAVSEEPDFFSGRDVTGYSWPASRSVGIRADQDTGRKALEVLIHELGHLAGYSEADCRAAEIWAWTTG